MEDLKVVVLEPGYASYGTERSVLSRLNAEIIPIRENVDVANALKDINPKVVLLRESEFRKEEIDLCPNLQGVIRYGVGVDNIDCDYAKEKLIYVANVPDYGAEIEVSEHAVALYLAIQRRLLSRDREVRAGAWGNSQHSPIPSRENAILGLVGCGRIGLEAAKKFRVLGFKKVIVFDPYLSDEMASRHQLEKVELADLCAQADVVSLHAPLTSETYHLLDKKMIALMKKTSVFINVSRGGLVDEDALAQALHRGEILGAGIDVFECEPAPLDTPLFASPNTIVSDHMAWYSERSVEMLQRKAAESAYQILTGKQPSSWVNRWK